MQQAAFVDRFGFDLLSSLDDGFGPAEIDIGGCEVAQTLVISMMVVVIDEVVDRCFQGAR
jgi:hypothetical protein